MQESLYVCIPLLLASVRPKLTYNWVVEFQFWSIGKGRIRLRGGRVMASHISIIRPQWEDSAVLYLFR